MPREQWFRNPRRLCCWVAVWPWRRPCAAVAVNGSRPAVSRFLYRRPPERAAVAAIPLGPPSLAGSSNLPGSCTGAGHAILPYLVLLHVGFSLPARVTAAAVRSYRTISPLPVPLRAIGGIFLLHFPSARAAQALPGTVPCGARTFLGMPKHDATVWPTPRVHSTTSSSNAPTSRFQTLIADCGHVGTRIGGENIHRVR